MKTIYELDIHESIDIFGVAEITRVPGGWVYRMYKTSTFVPFSKEGDKKALIDHHRLHPQIEYTKPLSSV